MPDRSRKRPRDRDPNQLANFLVDAATAASDDAQGVRKEPEKNPAAVALGRLGGIKGGRRGLRLCPTRGASGLRSLLRSRAGGMTNNIHKRIWAERGQYPTTRTAAIQAVEKGLGGRTLITFFTSFNHVVEIDADDCDMLQSVLQHIDLSKGLALMIDSPGGDGLAAELIVNTCRAYSGTGDYWAIVPGSAKSAASIICMGASKIMMADTSQLGPVDPQIIRREGDGWRQFSAHNLVSSYDRLFGEAVKTKGNLEPFIQQLQAFDVRDINHYRDLIKLSEDIAIKILKTGMMTKKTKAQIRKSIRLFLDPNMGTISHSRSISRVEAEGCGLGVEKMDVHSAAWRAIYELYVRTQEFVNSSYASKCVESTDEVFTVPPPTQRP